ncbi:1-acyl-sn-glycerol-3-phosphate acyltransferase [Candidatus Binatia bacterium]|jgi:1-acyl-sn-glycerol-3-phosphate acyltransferase|nr:1-acyl-sn-glycerol-3-phosphate acyltransferase [Candidatus Binatia bacterium]
MLAGNAGTAVGAPRGVAWPQLPDGASAAWRAWTRLLALRRSVNDACRALGRSGTPLDDAALLRSRAYSLSRLSGAICASNGLRIALSGPIPQGPVVLVANHVGYLDPLVLASIVPCVPVAKRELASWPLIGRAARAHGVLFVERGAVASGAAVLRGARRALAASLSVLNFPEGTTTRGDRVLPFRRGVFGLARLAAVPVVPAALVPDDDGLTWVGDELLLPHLTRTLARRENAIRVRFGRALLPHRFGSAADLAREAHDVVEHLLGEG